MKSEKYGGYMIAFSVLTTFGITFIKAACNSKNQEHIQEKREFKNTIFHFSFFIFHYIV
jgi:hypothetical protein